MTGLTTLCRQVVCLSGLSWRLRFGGHWCTAFCWSHSRCVISVDLHWDTYRWTCVENYFLSDICLFAPLQNEEDVILPLYFFEYRLNPTTQNILLQIAGRYSRSLILWEKSWDVGNEPLHETFVNMLFTTKDDAADIFLTEYSQSSTSEKQNGDSQLTITPLRLSFLI